MKQLGWCMKNDADFSIIKVPLQFTFPPVEALMKQLTKLNSPHPYRIAYLGPRWDNSILFHKKYSNGGSYEFNQRKINKNTNLLNDSMTHNQFYRNEIYYRAFQGMNPTLNLAEEIVFQSRFQSGNLDCVVKISDTQYDLFLRIDSNTRGHIFWYYFSVKNHSKSKKIKINISNLTKNGTHYSQGLNPFMYSQNSKEWRQEGCSNVTFQQKRLRYEFLYEKLKLGIFYELSFEVEFKENEEIKFAYCIPYSYSDLLQDLKFISKDVQVNTLGYSLTGVKIPIVFIGKHEQQNIKPVLLITGRIHPGQSNSSLILSRLMKYLIFSPQAKFLREKVLTVIVPMMNPDGVIIGNSRCGASGKDLNREFKTRAKAMYPQIILLKNLTHDLENYLDFHGHSRKKNMFIFGPSYNITQPQYYKCRVFPKILSSIIPLFRYYGSSYEISYDKRSTARAVMLNQMMIPFVFTVETSLGFYYDYQNKKNMVFTRQKWQAIGQSVVKALVQYYQGLNQYDQFIQQKKKSKKHISEQIKINQERILLNNSQLASSIKKPKKEFNIQPQEIKIFKIYEEIKQLQQKKAKQLKKQKDKEDEDSDSHDEKQDLQKQKLHQFNGMVAEYVEQQTKKAAKYLEGKHSNEKNQENIIEKKKNRQLRKKRKESSIKQEQFLLAEYTESNKRSITKRSQIKTQNKNRNVYRESIIFHHDRKQVKSHQFPKKSEKTSYQMPQVAIKQAEKKTFIKDYLQQQADFSLIQKKNNKLNVRMFNFSKMVQNPISLRYDTYKQTPKYSSHCTNKKNSLDSRKNPHQSEIINHLHQSNRFGALDIECQYDDQLQMGQQLKKNNFDDGKHIKGRFGFPPSFYRIKYHNNQRRRHETKKQRQLNQFQEYKRIKQIQNQHHYTNYTKNPIQKYQKYNLNFYKKQTSQQKINHKFKK